MKLGYLVSQYPAVNHTYILREIVSLRALGLDICVVSVRPCDRAQSLLSEIESDERRRTFSILGAGLLHILHAHLRVLVRHPLRYLCGLAFAVQLTKGTPRLLLPYLAYFAEAVVAGNYFTKHGTSSIHSHYASTVLLILSRVFPIRYSLTLHGSAEFLDAGGFHLARKVAESYFTITVSLFGLSQVMNASDPRHWHKLVTIPLGVDTAAFVPVTSDLFQRPERPFNLLCVGHLSHVKGYPVLIEAIRLVRLRGLDVKLTIVGGGKTRGFLETLIERAALQPHVRLEGERNHESVLEYFRSSDAFALSSFQEGVPVVLMEAMAMELPCVASGITGIPELIENGIDGLLVPPASPEHIADAIGQLMTDPKLARRLGKAARLKVLEKYDLRRNTNRLRDVFRRYS